MKWNRAAANRLHENKKSREMLISTAYVIKYNAKVSKLVVVYEN